MLPLYKRFLPDDKAPLPNLLVELLHDLIGTHGLLPGQLAYLGTQISGFHFILKIIFKFWIIMIRISSARLITSLHLWIQSTIFSFQKSAWCTSCCCCCLRCSRSNNQRLRCFSSRTDQPTSSPCSASSTRSSASPAAGGDDASSLPSIRCPTVSS